jgi:hypothetical protein
MPPKKKQATKNSYQNFILSPRLRSTLKQSLNLSTSNEKAVLDEFSIALGNYKSHLLEKIETPTQEDINESLTTLRLKLKNLYDGTNIADKDVDKIIKYLNRYMGGPVRKNTKTRKLGGTKTRQVYGFAMIGGFEFENKLASLYGINSHKEVISELIHKIDSLKGKSGANIKYEHIGIAHDIGYIFSQILNIKPTKYQPLNVNSKNYRGGGQFELVVKECMDAVHNNINANKGHPVIKNISAESVHKICSTAMKYHPISTK